MLRALGQESHIVLENIGTLGFDWDRHTLFDCGVLRAQVLSLANNDNIWIEKVVAHRGNCMATSLCPSGLKARTNHNAMSIGLRKD